MLDAHLSFLPGCGYHLLIQVDANLIQDLVHQIVRLFLLLIALHNTGLTYQQSFLKSLDRSIYVHTHALPTAYASTCQAYPMPLSRCSQITICSSLH